MLSTLSRRLPDVLARDDEGAVLLQAIPSEGRLPEFDLDDLDDLVAGRGPRAASRLRGSRYDRWRANRPSLARTGASALTLTDLADLTRSAKCVRCGHRGQFC